MRGLLRIPFEKAADKRAIPGVASLVKALRRTAAEGGRTTSVSFVTASPPQIGRAIREKLLLDGIEFDEIRFKDQFRHLMRGRFDVLREQVGFKLAELLQSARSGGADGEEILFGDDWESDPLIYSLYADAIAGRLPWTRLEGILVAAGVHVDYRDSIRESLGQPGPHRDVRAICILRARPRSGEDLEVFAPRLFWFDGYVEAALILHALGDVDARGVVDVAAASALEPDLVTAAFEATATRWPRLRREHLTIARKRLLEDGRIRPVDAGALLRRAAVRLRVLTGKSPLPPLATATPVPDYERLVHQWSSRARKEREKEARLELEHDAE